MIPRTSVRASTWLDHQGYRDWPSESCSWPHLPEGDVADASRRTYGWCATSECPKKIGMLSIRFMCHFTFFFHQSQNKLMVAQQCQMVEILVNTGSGNGLVPDSTKPLPGPMLTYHQWGLVAFTWGQFHEKCSRYLSLAIIDLRLQLHLLEANKLRHLCNKQVSEASTGDYTTQNDLRHNYLSSSW